MREALASNGLFAMPRTACRCKMPSDGFHGPLLRASFCCLPLRKPALLQRTGLAACSLVTSTLGGSAGPDSIHAPAVDTPARLHDNVGTLDRLVLQLAQQIHFRPRGGGWLRADMHRLTQACEAALPAVLMQRPLREIRMQLEQVHRQLVLLAEMVRRSNGRCTGRPHEDLCRARQRLQAPVHSLP